MNTTEHNAKHPACQERTAKPTLNTPTTHHIRLRRAKADAHTAGHATARREQPWSSAHRLCAQAAAHTTISAQTRPRRSKSPQGTGSQQRTREPRAHRRRVVAQLDIRCIHADRRVRATTKARRTTRPTVGRRDAHRRREQLRPARKRRCDRYARRLSAIGAARLVVLAVDHDVRLVIRILRGRHGRLTLRRAQRDPQRATRDRGAHRRRIHPDRARIRRRLHRRAVIFRRRTTTLSTRIDRTTVSHSHPIRGALPALRSAPAHPTPAIRNSSDRRS